MAGLQFVAVSILELAAISGSSRMSRVPNFHFATQLLNVNFKICIGDITWWVEDMNFIFECQNSILRTIASSE